MQVVVHPELRHVAQAIRVFDSLFFTPREMSQFGTRDADVLICETGNQNKKTGNSFGMSRAMGAGHVLILPQVEQCEGQR